MTHRISSQFNNSSHRLHLSKCLNHHSITTKTCSLVVPSTLATLLEFWGICNLRWDSTNKHLSPNEAVDAAAEGVEEEAEVVAGPKKIKL